MAHNRPRVIFMGTPEFAVPALEALAREPSIELGMVVTQPDRPAGRGRRLTPPAVKVAADRLGLPLVQASTLRDPVIRDRIIGIRPDLIVVAAFGMILGRWILELPTRGCVNLHASLLPRYRGANPIAAAILEGANETGITLMRMDRGLDTGPMLAQLRIALRPDQTTETLTPELATAAAALLSANLGALLRGELPATPQPTGGTITRPMTKVDGWIDWTRRADEIERQVRAMDPWPRAWTTSHTGRIQILGACVVGDAEGEPGTVIQSDHATRIVCGKGALTLLRVQPAGGRPLHGHALQHVRGLEHGDVLGRIGGPPHQPPLVMPV